MEAQSSKMSAWILMNILVIIICAFLILLPALHGENLLRLGLGLLVLPVYLVMMILEARRSGLGKLSIPQLYQAARQGRRLKVAALEFAAIVAIGLAQFH